MKENQKQSRTEFKRVLSTAGLLNARIIVTPSVFADWCVCARVSLGNLVGSLECVCVCCSVVKSDPIFITHWLKEEVEALACSSDKCITPINPVYTEVLNADKHTQTHTQRGMERIEVVTERNGGS